MEETRKETDTNISVVQEKKSIDEVLKLNMQDLVNYCVANHIDVYAKTRLQLLTELGITGVKGGKVYVRPMPSPDKLQYLQSRNMTIPMNTIFPAEDFDSWLRIVAKEPFAFNGADLTDKNATIQHTLKTKVKCPCGAKFEFPRDLATGKYEEIMMCPGVQSTIIRKGKIYDVRTCIGIGQFRKWIYHNLDDLEK